MLDKKKEVKRKIIKKTYLKMQSRLMCRCSKKKVINDDLKDTMRVEINDDLKVN